MFKKIISYFFILIVSSLVFSSISKVSAATLTCSDNLAGKVQITEFVTGDGTTSTQWIELFNNDQDNSVDLSGCTLRNGADTNLKSLTGGTLPRRGFLTFTLNSALVTTGGTIRLVGSDGATTFYAIYYGTQSGSPHAAAPSSSQSAYAPLGSGDWSVGTSTKGWCNPGFTGCPTIADIVSEMNSAGVKTNLGDMSDYSRVSGLYFQKSETNDPNGNPIGKITFLSEMNFTDKDALSWMQNLDSYIDMSVKGRIGLNAELIKNLTSTNATLTMYGLTYSDPTIDVTNADGTPGDNSIISGLTYDKATGSLTFTAAHFTTFTSKEKSTGGSSTTSNPVCSQEAPNKSPDLFQIDTTKNSARLFFTPVNNAVDQYYIAYGFSQGDERFGVKFNKGYYDGVIDFTINELASNTNYYFKVRAGNGCATGSWSNWLVAKTDGSFTQTAISSSPAINASPSIEVPGSVKETVIEPTRSIQTPTLGAADVVPPQPIIKKSWLDRLIGFFTNLFK